MSLRALFPSLFMILLASPMWAFGSEGAKASCMSRHMKDAIMINQERGPWYAELSEGRSRAVTRRLIRMERLLLVSAPALDLWARQYQKNGIAVVCEDLIEMSETPAFRAHNPKGKVAKNTYRPVKIELVEEKLRERLKTRDYRGLSWLADQYVQQLEKQPRYNCLVRHMLESIRRSAALIPKYEKLAEQKALSSPEPLSRLFLKGHLDLLKESALIDRLAAPLQADGIMIVCQDVPHIKKPAL